MSAPAGDALATVAAAIAAADAAPTAGAALEALAEGARRLGWMGAAADVGAGTMVPGAAPAGADASPGAAVALLEREARAQCARRDDLALAESARALQGSLRLADVFALVVRHAAALVGADAAAIAQRAGERLEVVAGPEGWLGAAVPLVGTTTGRALLDGRAAAHDDLSGEWPARGGAALPAVVAPLLAASGAIGALVAAGGRRFGARDALLIERLAAQAAPAIVSARLYAEAARATREWRVAFDAIASGIVVLDDAGRVRRCNGRAAELCGLDLPSALVGRRLVDALHGGEPGEPGPVEGVLADGTTTRGVVRVARRGRVFAVLAAPHPDGGAVVTFDDVTSHHTLAERHARVLETTADAIVIADPRGVVAFANPAAEALFARTPLVGERLAALSAPGRGDELAARLRLALAGEPQSFESEALRPDGGRRQLAVAATALTEVGQRTGTVLSLHDVTDEARAREAVAASEARYRNLFESASDAVYTLDARGRFTSLNAATVRLIGRPAAEVLGTDVTAVLVGDELPAIREAFRATLAGESRFYECHMRHADGTLRPLSVANTPIRECDGVAGVLGIARDLTAERERTLALERSEARYTRLVELAADAIFTVDAAGEVTGANRAMCTALGLPRSSIVGRGLAELVDARDSARIAALAAAIAAGSRHRGELRYTSARGDLRTASVLAAPVPTAAGAPDALVVARDVTEERRLGAQLLQQEKLAAVGQLVSGVAHELNNPLAGVMAFSQILLATPGIEGDDRAAAETIHREARRAARIVTSLLTFARQHGPERAVVDAGRVVTDVLELRRYALRQADVAVEVDLAPALPPTWADPFQLQQVLLNLVANAEQAMADWPGERRLRVSAASDGATITIAVADSGPGVADADAPRVFDPFFTTKPVGKGTGLGLSISDGIVREHGGRIRLESRSGAGATFFVELPVTPTPPVTTPTREHPAFRRSPAPALRAVRADHAAGAPYGGEAPRVLVVDDEPAIRRAVATVLGGAGFVVVQADGGREALRLVEEAGPFDALLLDLGMPDLPGDQLFDEIARRDPALARRVLVVTGDVHGERAQRFLARAARPVLTKPFVIDDLLVAVRRVAGVPQG